VTVLDGGSSALGTTTATSSGSWSFSTAALSAGSYAFAATDTTSAGTSSASNAFDVTVSDPPSVNSVLESPSRGAARCSRSGDSCRWHPDGDSGLLTLSDGALNAKIALLGHYIASSFALSADSNSATKVAEMGHIADPTLLANPH
jgi:hypothetical protein